MSSETEHPATEIVIASARALRRRAAAQRAIATSETMSPKNYPGVLVVSGRGAVARRIAESLEEIATGLEAEYAHPRN
jgi:hypothetical protein